MRARIFGPLFGQHQRCDQAGRLDVAGLIHVILNKIDTFRAESRED